VEEGEGFGEQEGVMGLPLLRSANLVGAGEEGCGTWRWFPTQQGGQVEGRSVAHLTLSLRLQCNNRGEHFQASRAQSGCILRTINMVSCVKSP
jgi:hypothetical protein